MLVGEPSPKKGEKGTTGDLSSWPQLLPYASGGTLPPPKREKGTTGGRRGVDGKVAETLDDYWGKPRKNIFCMSATKWEVALGHLGVGKIEQLSIGCPCARA